MYSEVCWLAPSSVSGLKRWQFTIAGEAQRVIRHLDAFKSIYFPVLWRHLSLINPRTNWAFYCFHFCPELLLDVSAKWHKRDCRCEWQSLRLKKHQPPHILCFIWRETQWCSLFLWFLNQCFEFSQKLDQSEDVGNGSAAASVMKARRVRDQRHSMTY